VTAATRGPQCEPPSPSVARATTGTYSLFMRSLGVLLVLGTILMACGSSPVGSACQAAGGSCVVGGAKCSKQAASSAQDCNPPPSNPGGFYCCMTP